MGATTFSNESSDGMPQQQFLLKWTNFQSSLLTYLPQMLDSQDLADVTLVASGNDTIQAHRVILSACSSMFRNLFMSLPPSHHPVIVLPTLPADDLKALIAFMYCGEVNIAQEQLSSILSTAEALKIHGLAEVPRREGLGKAAKLASSKMPTETKPVPVEKEENSRDMWIDEGVNHVDRPAAVKSEEMQQEETPTADDAVAPDETIMTDEYGGTILYSENPSFLNNPAPSVSNPTASGSCTCPVCGKQFRNKYNLRVHLETHENRIYACCFCSHTSRSRDALRKHTSYRHGGEHKNAPRRSKKLKGDVGL